MGLAFAVASMLCFAANIFVARAAVTRMEPNLGFAVLLAVNTLVAAIVASIDVGLRARPFSIEWGPLGLFALAGIVGIFMGRRMMLDAIQTLGPARASVLHTITPVSTAIAAWAIAGERLGPRELAAMAVVMVGLVLLQPRAERGKAAGAAFGWRGLGVGLLCISGFGLGNALRGVATQSWFEPAFASICSSGAALLCQAAILPAKSGVPQRLATADRRGLWLYVASGVVTVFGSIFNSAAMAYVEISIVMLITYSSPLIVFPVSLFILKNDERLSGRNLVGAMLAVAGLVFIALR